METKIIEVTNGPQNWGKFLLGRFDNEWQYNSVIGTGKLLRSRGHHEREILVVDLETCEGAIFSPGGMAKADLDKHRIWVCPMFEPFLVWLYKQDLMRPLTQLPSHVDLPDAPFSLRGYRREGGKK